MKTQALSNTAQQTDISASMHSAQCPQEVCALLGLGNAGPKEAKASDIGSNSSVPLK